MVYHSFFPPVGLENPGRCQVQIDCFENFTTKRNALCWRVLRRAGTYWSSEQQAPAGLPWALGTEVVQILFSWGLPPLCPLLCLVQATLLGQLCLVQATLKLQGLLVLCLHRHFAGLLAWPLGGAAPSHPANCPSCGLLPLQRLAPHQQELQQCQMAPPPLQCQMAPPPLW